ncbi:hypothetical protein [Actinoplanes sp. HUAS TT8]|uniref:hypothetical protein n=1 Tax=Actinoplanes sp. HUAS TT8 TaxID=3447453 RepID=UPI003F5271EC
MPSEPHIEWSAESTTIRWPHDGKIVVKTLERPPEDVLYWPQPASILVLEPIIDGRLDNLAVLNLDGQERLRMRPPQVVSEPTWNRGFYAIYPSEGVLVTVFKTEVGDWWGDPDLETGELRNVTQWR